MSTMSFAYAIVALGVSASWHQATAEVHKFDSFVEWCENREGLTCRP